MRAVLFIVLISKCVQAQEVEVVPVQTDSAIHFYARSTYHCHYTVEVKPATFENMTSSVAFPAVFIIEPLAQRQYLMSIKPTTKTKGWRYSFRYKLDQGDVVNAKHDDEYVYALPYQSARKHTLVQGYFGTFSHTGTHALDFEMAEGTHVVAAREGVVVNIKDDSNKGGTKPDLMSEANYIMIYHRDGSFGSYFHLKKDGVLVKVGQYVQKGEVIGLSGNTGFSSAPHLHFEVLLPTGDKKRTTPTQFKIADGQTQVLVEGKAY